MTRLRPGTSVSVKVFVANRGRGKASTCHQREEMSLALMVQGSRLSSLASSQRLIRMTMKGGAWVA